MIFPLPATLIACDAPPPVEDWKMPALLLVAPVVLIAAVPPVMEMLPPAVTFTVWVALVLLLTVLPERSQRPGGLSPPVRVPPPTTRPPEPMEICCEAVEPATVSMAALLCAPV